ncbi:NUDIX hydrolase [Arachidicoccus ginsenosidimutans]|uniref:NUDIX hydrolase n=1 Tax=Arachidicoccus sp. BS20 TaxID=1850526 RepID=UPI0018D37506|nr:NUDIX domain-containing protein [Arachidicoccus sp. BS20]
MKKVLAAGGIVINQDKELLMIFRRLLWDLPKGHLDKGETLEGCAIHEVQEETGLKNLQLKGFVGKTEHIYYERKFREEAIKETHWFEMLGDKNEQLIPLEKESIERAEWVPKSKLKKYLFNTFENVEEIIKKSSIYN